MAEYQLPFTGAQVEVILNIANALADWAKASEKPTYTADEVGARPSTWTPSASDVGADPVGTAAGAVSSHNTAYDAHSDIRLLVAGLTTRLNALADSDDETLDQVSELVAYIKANRSLIEQITTGKVSVTDIINNLTTNISDKPLSAAQGVVLKGLIDALQTAVNSAAANLSSHTGNDTVHITSAERTKWNQAVTDVGNLSEEIADYIVVDYVRTEAESVAEKILAITGEGDKDCIPFVVACPSDLHYIGGERYLHTAQAIDVIKETAPIDLTCLIGDYIPNWTEKTKEEAVNCITELKKLFEDEIFLMGNHDRNQYPNQSISKAEGFMRICRKNGYITNFEDPYGCYGYKDFELFKMRVLFVNTSDNAHVADPTTVNEGVVSPVINCHNITAKQLQWFADYGLDFSDKGSPSEWGIVILSHVPITNDTWAQYWDSAGNVWECNVQNFSNMLKAYVDKETFTVTLNGETCTKDFSQNTETAEVTVFINGHGHAEKVTTLNGFTHIWCPSVHPTTKVSDDGNTYTKTAGTAKETAFNVVVIDRANKKAHALIYGAGTDRIIDFAGSISTKYTVTNNLSNCSNNNSIASVAEGESYTAIITANSGFELSSVTVTMGGVDITATAVSGGNINISEVTGNIVITATTEEVYVLINQIPLSTDAGGNLFNGGQGWKTNTRLSLSGGGETAASNYECTGFIPVKNKDVISIKDIDLTNENSTNIVCYDNDKNPYNGGASTYGMKLYTLFVEKGTESNGVYTATLNGDIFSGFGINLAYIRIGSKSITNESIVTVNQEIK